MRYRTDSSWLRTGDDHRIVVAGSPARMFRLTAAGARVIDRVEQGKDVEPSSLVERLVDAGALHPIPDRSAAAFTRNDVTVVTPQLGGIATRDGRITVDDGSSPPVEGATTRLPVNRGPATARNSGRRLVDTELIAFVDADVDIDGSWLDVLLPHFADPVVGLVAPRVRGGQRTSLDLGTEPARIRVGTRVAYVPAAAIVVRATAFDDVGGFDETLRFGEDVDFVWRLDAAGWSCRYEPRSSVWHEPRPTLMARLRQQVGYGSSAAPLALRHPHALAPFRSSLWNSSVWLLVASGHPIVGVGVAIGGAITAVRKLVGVPAPTSVRLAAHAQLASGRQLATAIRRAWWPIVVVLAVVSKRARLVAVAAVLADPRAVPTEAAYGWGVWRGMWERFTWRPIMPSVSRFNASAPVRRRRPRPLR